MPEECTIVHVGDTAFVKLFGDSASLKRLASVYDLSQIEETWFRIPARLSMSGAPLSRYRPLGVALWCFVSGVLTLHLAWLIHVDSLPELLTRYLVLPLFAALALTASILLWRRRRLGGVLTVLYAAFQVPIVSTSAFSYEYFAIASRRTTI